MRLPALLLSCVLLSGCASLNAGDRVWERIERHNPKLYQLDNRPWKTWIGHGVVTGVGGLAIGALTPLSVKQGLRIMAGFYITREAAELFQGSHEYGDMAMDALLPVTVSSLRVSFRWNW